MELKKGYSIIIEPDIYEKLNWDLDLIISCLETIRIELPKLLQIDDENIQFDLFCMTNFLSQKSPVIGINGLNPEIYNWLEIDEKVNDWIYKTGIERIISESFKNKYISWEKLIENGSYPERKLV